MDRSLTQFYFYNNEHPTSVKCNNVLSAVEEVRKFSGPISLNDIDNNNNSTTVKYIKILDTGHEIGGGCTDGTMINAMLTAYRLFTVYYVTSGTVPDHSGYVRWENVILISGTSDDGFIDEPPYPWFIRLADTALSGYNYVASGSVGEEAGQLNLSNVSIENFVCMPQPYIVTGVN